jgi:fermentation-respiration switch protein FrsA (DUF1100 family)
MTADPAALVEAIDDRMAKLAELQRYEDAARWRDRVSALLRAAHRTQRLRSLTAEAELIAATYPEGYPLENARLALDFSPERWVAAIAPRALCLITPSDDTVIPAEQSTSMYVRAGEPKALHLLPHGGHGGPMGPLVDTTAELTASFLDAHLRTTPAS